MSLMRWPELSSDMEQSDPGTGEGGRQDHGEQCGGWENRKKMNRVWANASLMGPRTRYPRPHQALFVSGACYNPPALSLL